MVMAMVVATVTGTAMETGVAVDAVMGMAGDGTMIVAAAVVVGMMIGVAEAAVTAGIVAATADMIEAAEIAAAAEIAGGVEAADHSSSLLGANFLF